LGQLVDLLIRNQIIKYNGISSNGNYQAALLLSSQLSNILLGSVGALAVATLGKSTDKNDLKKTINDLLTVIIPIMVVAQGVLITNSKLIIHLLYSNRFSLAVFYLPWILVADFFMAIAWIFGSPLLTMGRKRLWLKIEIIFWTVKLVSTTIAIKIDPVYGIVAGGIITNFIHVVINYAVLRKLTDYKLKIAQHIELGGGILLLLLFSVFLYFNNISVYVVSCMLLLLVAVYFVKKIGLMPLKFKSVR
jgi:O-antigen/teichoic acid export membrane protein